MELFKSVLVIVTAVIVIGAVIFAKVWLVATGLSMILGVTVNLFPVLLIVLGLGIKFGGTSD